MVPLMVSVGLYVASALLYFAFFHHIEKAKDIHLPLPLPDLKG